MSVQEFLSTKNINLIWIVIQEEEIIQNQSPDLVENVIKFIQSNLYDFFEQEKGKVKNLQELNKKFIMLILKYITSLIKHPLKQNKSNVLKNPIINLDETPELVTFEEIQKSKLDNFDRQLQEKQNEFSSAIKNHIPETPIFSDQLDTPLIESDLLVKKMQEQRIWEEENFKLGQTNEDWIKPIETSIKKTKISETNNSPPIKYIKIEKEIENPIQNIINLNSSTQKHISWKLDLIELEKENIHQDIKEENDFNIFSKLKKTNRNENIITSNELDSLKEDIKIMFSKMEDMNTTINNILTWMKEKVP
jgi:hypothetical protein